MNKDLGVWTHDGCALLLIDYQNEMQVSAEALLAVTNYAQGPHYFPSCDCESSTIPDGRSANRNLYLS